MSEKKLFYGDKLPTSILSKKDWIDIRDWVEDMEKPLSYENYKAVLAKMETLAIKYCKGKNKDTCLLCGLPDINKKGLCRECMRALKTRGLLRQCGHVKGYLNEQLVCRGCHERNAKTMGLCRRCYWEYKYYKYPDMKSFLAKKDAERKERQVAIKVRPHDILTPRL